MLIKVSVVSGLDHTHGPPTFDDVIANTDYIQSVTPTAKYWFKLNGQGLIVKMADGTELLCKGSANDFLPGGDIANTPTEAGEG